MTQFVGEQGWLRCDVSTWDATYAWEAREAHSLSIYAYYAATGTPAVGCGGAAFGVVAAASLDASFLNIYSEHPPSVTRSQLMEMADGTHLRVDLRGLPAADGPLPVDHDERHAVHAFPPRLRHHRLHLVQALVGF